MIVYQPNLILIRTLTLCIFLSYCKMFGIEYFRMLSKKDIEVIVENGSPLLFRNGDNSVRRMRSFLNGSESNVSFLILKLITF